MKFSRSPRLLCGKEAEALRSSSLILLRSLPGTSARCFGAVVRFERRPPPPVRAPSPLSSTVTVAHSRFQFHECSGSQKRNRMKNAYLAFCVEITAGGEQERRFKVQSDALQPCCSVLSPQRELISIDRARGGQGKGRRAICLQGCTWKACLKNFLSPQITPTLSHLNFFQPCPFLGRDGLPRSIWPRPYSETVWRWRGGEVQWGGN